MACAAEAASPTLSISRVPPAAVQFSWPSNFTDWQLTSTTNLASANWQAVTQVPVASGNALVVLFPFTNLSGYFRLKQTGGGCVFQATPPVINSGGSSTLSWCPVGGVTYRVSPGPGIVASGSLIVSPTVTTVYTLTASNAVGVVTNFATVVVGPCGFASVTNWVGTLNFTYALAPSSSGLSFNVNQQAQLTFNLTRSGGTDDSPLFTGTLGGTGSMNDREDDSSFGSLLTTIDAGTSPPVPAISTVVFAINCASNSYLFSVIAGIDIISTSISDGISSSSPTSTIVGQIVVLPRALPVGTNTISGSALLPAIGPFTIPNYDYFAPNSFIANDMWLNGVITDATAGNASVSWSFTPAP